MGFARDKDNQMPNTLSSERSWCRKLVNTGVSYAAFGGAIEHENGIPLHWSEGVKELRELQQVPPRTRGDFRGVVGNPHQVLIQLWLPPSSPPLAKGGRVREQRASARTHEFFHTFRGVGVGCCGREGPTPEG